MELRRLVAALGLLVGVIGIVIDFALIIPSGTMTGGVKAGSPLDAQIDFWTYFTHLTNLALVLIYLSELTGWRWLGWFRQAGTRAMMVAYILLVMSFYHFMLAPNYHFEGGLLVATILLHYVAPTLYVLWWLVLARHGELSFRRVPYLLVPGILYVAWVLVRGAVVNVYPYDILDAGKHGYGAVAIGTLVLLVIVLVFCLIAVWIDGPLGRRQNRSAGPQLS